LGENTVPSILIAYEISTVRLVYADVFEVLHDFATNDIDSPSTATDVVELLRDFRNWILNSDLNKWRLNQDPACPLGISIGGIAFLSDTRGVAFRRGAFEVKLGSEILLKSESVNANEEIAKESVRRQQLPIYSVDILDREMVMADCAEFWGRDSEIAVNDPLIVDEKLSVMRVGSLKDPADQPAGVWCYRWAG
jgi:hypothetical protein